MVLQQGRIIVANVKDPQGRNEKERFLVVVSEDSAIQVDKPFWCVAVSGTLPDTLTEDHVLLPWHNSKHPLTKLTKR